MVEGGAQWIQVPSPSDALWHYSHPHRGGCLIGSGKDAVWMNEIRKLSDMTITLTPKGWSIPLDGNGPTSVGVWKANFVTAMLASPSGPFIPLLPPSRRSIKNAKSKKPCCLRKSRALLNLANRHSAANQIAPPDRALVLTIWRFPYPRKDLGALRPSLPLRYKRFRSFRKLMGKIIQFSPISLNVV